MFSFLLPYPGQKQEGNQKVKQENWADWMGVLCSAACVNMADWASRDKGFASVFLCINTCSSKSLQAQTSSKSWARKINRGFMVAACWYLQKQNWFEHQESDNPNKVRDKRLTTSQTFSNETVKATTQWPGGSWRSEVERVTVEKEEPLACLFAH